MPQKEWGRASKTRYQQSGRVVSLRSLLLALKHKNSTDPELFRSLTLHTEALERVCAELDKEEAKKKRDAAMAINKKIAGSVVKMRDRIHREGGGNSNNEGNGQRSGQVVKKRPQLKMKQPRCALVKAVEAYMKKLCD